MKLFFKLIILSGGVGLALFGVLDILEFSPKIKTQGTVIAIILIVFALFLSILSVVNYLFDILGISSLPEKYIQYKDQSISNKLKNSDYMDAAIPDVINLINSAMVARYTTKNGKLIEIFPEINKSKTRIEYRLNKQDVVTITEEFENKNEIVDAIMQSYYAQQYLTINSHKLALYPVFHEDYVLRMIELDELKTIINDIADQTITINRQ